MSITPGSVAVVLPAAGKSRRFGGSEKKIFAPLCGSAVWEHAARRLRSRPEVGPILIAIDPDDRQIWQGEFAEGLARHAVRIVDGGAERAESVSLALEAIADADYIAVHDAARPLVSDRDLGAVLAAAEATGAAILASRLRGTIKRQDADQLVSETVDRRDLWEALTPQVFRADLLRHAYARWNGFPATDDAQMVERSGHPVCLVEGSPTNIKITVSDDLRIATALLASEPDPS